MTLEFSISSPNQIIIETRKRKPQKMAISMKINPSFLTISISTPLLLSLLLLFSSFFFCQTQAYNYSSSWSSSSSSAPPGYNITWWCSKTPHPESCKYFTNQSHRHYFPPKHRSEFRKIMVQLAYDQALNVQRHVMEYGPSCENELQKAAWNDCSKLYESTILQLNRTLQGLEEPDRMCTDFDAQTWLSSALTNIQTCNSGCSDLNISDFVTPNMSQNLSQLISNSLALNGVILKSRENKNNNNSNSNSTNSYVDGFPTWVSNHDRKLLQTTASRTRANIVVAKDGSGHFRSVQAAINLAARRRSTGRFVIYVKRGVYNENIEVGDNNNDIMLVGDGLRYTIISSGRSVRAGYTTYSSATAGIDGRRFIARGIAFRNTAGPARGQAVALRSASDLSVFYLCSFEGYQDTLMVHSQRQFYRECYVYGTIDFIFGNAAVVFQKCLIYVRRPLRGQANMITAQGRTDPYQNTAISIHHSMILPAPDLRPVARSFKTYLGRPWQQYSRTIIMKTYIDGFISPLGWSAWGNNAKLNTLFYGEYQNFGSGSSIRYRVRWRGFHAIKSASVASRFTVGSLIAGRSWLPATGVPFSAGL